MSSYEALSEFYDRLTGDVRYDLFADYYEHQFDNHSGEFKLLLDLCCGTGTLTEIMYNRGFELIAVDKSEEMLMEAREKYIVKNDSDKVIPLFLCQEAGKLDLFGTVDAAYCSLDGINYLNKAELKRTFLRLKNFIRPGGLLIFDVRTECFFEQTDGQILVDEDDDMLCLWRADYYAKEARMIYGMDIFSKDKATNCWKREKEEHVEYYHSIKNLESLLKKNLFGNISIAENILDNDPERLFITAERLTC